MVLFVLVSLVSLLPRQLATSLGLSAVALSLPVTTAEAARGLVPPAAAGHFLGSAGSAVVLVMTFLAVTSSGASEQIAVSSIVGTCPSVPLNRSCGLWIVGARCSGEGWRLPCTVADCFAPTLGLMCESSLVSCRFPLQPDV